MYEICTLSLLQQGGNIPPDCCFTSKKETENNELLESAITIDALIEVKRFKRVQRPFLLFLTSGEK